MECWMKGEGIQHLKSCNGPASIFYLSMSAQCKTLVYHGEREKYQ
jgi:hypothetical protein